MATTRPPVYSAALSSGGSVLAGLLLVTQNGLNTSLRRAAFPNPFQTAAVSFSVGFGCVFAAAMAHRPRCNDGASLRGAPWYAYLGGPLGCCYVVAAIFLSVSLGFATFQLAATLGQLSCSLVCDAIGFLVLPKRKPTRWRLLALATMCGATGMSIQGVSVEGNWLALVGFIVLAFASGCIFPVQACINGRLVRQVKTPLRAASFSFAGGASVLWIATAITSNTALASWPEGEPAGAGPSGTDWWMWTGGACGGFVVSAHVFGVPIIGAARFTVLFIAAQLCTSLAFDSVGAFGYDAVPPSPRRIAGVTLAIAAAAAYQLGPPPVRAWWRRLRGLRMRGTRLASVAEGSDRDAASRGSVDAVEGAVLAGGRKDVADGRREDAANGGAAVSSFSKGGCTLVVEAEAHV